MVPWCAKIEKESAGKLKCQIYPSMQMGGTPQQFGQFVQREFEKWRTVVKESGAVAE